MIRTLYDSRSETEVRISSISSKLCAFSMNIVRETFSPRVYLLFLGITRFLEMQDKEKVCKNGQPDCLINKILHMIAIRTFLNVWFRVQNDMVLLFALFQPTQNTAHRHTHCWNTMYIYAILDALIKLNVLPCNLFVYPYYPCNGTVRVQHQINCRGIVKPYMSFASFLLQQHLRCNCMISFSLSYY